MSILAQFWKGSLLPKLPILSCLGLGGLLVLGSYLGCYLYYGSQVLLKLWGNISGATRNFYLFSMLLSTLGFLALVGFLIKLYPVTKVIGVAFQKSQWWYCAAGALFLLPSAFWMPSSIRYLQQPSQLLRNIIKGLLWAAAAGGLGITYLVSGTQIVSGWKQLALLGTGWLSFHLVVLDAIYWPLNFFTLT